MKLVCVLTISWIDLLQMHIYYAVGIEKRKHMGAAHFDMNNQQTFKPLIF